MKRSEILFSIILIPIDLAMLILAGLTAYGLRTGVLSYFRPVEFTLNLPFERYLPLVILVALGFILVFSLSGLYKIRSAVKISEEVIKLIIASSAAVMLLIVFLFLRQELFDSRFLIIGPWFLGLVFVIIGRVFVRALQRIITNKFNYGRHRILVIGDDDLSRQIINIIKSSKKLGYDLFASEKEIDLIRVAELLRSNAIDEIILADPNYDQELVAELISLCNEAHVVFKFVPNIYHTLTTNFEFGTIGETPIIELRRTALGGWGMIIKRAIDIFGSLFGIIILMPLFILIGLVIKYDSKGPVLVKLKRVSQKKEFWMYKFRSMIANAESMKQDLSHLNERDDGPLFKLRNDPRVTRFGTFLRKYRIDEFPQLINVLFGDMSLVGPRPHQPDEIAKYARHHKRVLAIKSGMTGLAQVSGSSDLSFDEEVALDSLYIERWSLWFDVKILFMTIAKLIFDKSAV